MSMKAIAIRHLAFEDLGGFAAELEQRGFEIAYREAGVDPLYDPELLEAELLVVLGGPIGAYEESSYPFLLDEMRLLEQRLQAKRATLGLCLGSQLMARVLGARVYAGEHKEIGWGPLQLTEEGKNSPVRHLEQIPVLHWHGDTFELPEGAVRLASSQYYENQAFAYHNHGLALQFHPEITRQGMERWFIGHAHEIAHTQGIDVAMLREATTKNADNLQRQGTQLLRQWLDLQPLSA